MKIHGTSLSVVQIVATSIIFLGVKREKEQKKRKTTGVTQAVEYIIYILNFSHNFSDIFSLCSNLGKKEEDDNGCER